MKPNTKAFAAVFFVHLVLVSQAIGWESYSRREGAVPEWLNVLLEILLPTSFFIGWGKQMQTIFLLVVNSSLYGFLAVTARMILLKRVK